MRRSLVQHPLDQSCPQAPPSRCIRHCDCQLRHLLVDPAVARIIAGESPYPASADRDLTVEGHNTKVSVGGSETLEVVPEPVLLKHEGVDARGLAKYDPEVDDIVAEDRLPG